MINTLLRQPFARYLVLILVGNFAISLANIQQISHDQQWVSHTQEVRQTVETTLLQMLNAESGYRGKLLTNDEVFLDSYQEALQKLPALIDELETLTRDNKVQVNTLPLLRENVGVKLDLIRETLRARDRGDEKTVTRLVQDGRKAMNRVRTTCAMLAGEEDRLMRIRNDKLRLSYQWMVANVLIFTMIICVVMACLAGYERGRS